VPRSEATGAGEKEGVSPLRHRHQDIAVDFPYTFSNWLRSRPPMTKKRTVTFRNLTSDEFERYFMLESPGYFLAKESYNAGEIGSAAEAVEILCLANKHYLMNLENRVMEELIPFGKQYAREYYDLARTDSEKASQLIAQVLGVKQTRLILKSVMEETKAALMIGQNEKKKRAELY
jgi:hypothetical protein